MEKLERTLSDVESDLEKEPAAVDKPTKKVKKVAKKAKKVAKKSKKAEKPEASEEGKISLAELASEANLTTAAARRRLRDAELSREGRWSWEDGSKAYKDARKALGLDD